MNLVHKDLVITYLLCWVVEFLHDIIMFLWDIKEAIGNCAKPKNEEGNKKNLHTKGDPKTKKTKDNEKKTEK